MYSINESTLRNLLQRKFNSLVGVCMEEIDSFQKKYDLNSIEIECFKKLMKKLNYEAMRDLVTLIESFSAGTKINVKLQKPTTC